MHSAMQLQQQQQQRSLLCSPRLDIDWIDCNSASSPLPVKKASWAAVIATAVAAPSSAAVSPAGAVPSASASLCIQLSLKSLQLPALVRDLSDASISSTPSPSDDEDASDSECEWVSSAASASGSDSDDSACSASTASTSGEWQQLSPSPCWNLAADIAKINEDLKAAWALQAEAELSAEPPILDLCSHVDEAAVESAALELEAAAAAEAASLASPAIPPSTVDVQYESRGRHKLASNRRGLAALIDVWRAPVREWTPTRDSARNVRFFKGTGKNGNRIQHLQLAACGLDRGCNRFTARNAANAAATKAAQEAKEEHEASANVPIYNPYDVKERVTKKLAPKFEAHESEVKDNAPRPLQRGNGKDGSHRVARARTHVDRHSLAAATRPALKNASSSFRSLLVDRAARKQALVQAEAKKEARVPKHLRVTSMGPKTLAQIVAAKQAQLAKSAAKASAASRKEPQVDTSVTVAGARSFNEFRERMFYKHRQHLEAALSHNNELRGFRLAPMGEAPRQRFMSALASCEEKEVNLVFHGTKLSNMQSICDRGLLVPNPSVNGVAVANGSAHGIGIYSCQEPSYPAGYARGTSKTLFVCAALTPEKNIPVRVSPGSEQTLPKFKRSGNVIVLFRDELIIPLFLMDFEPAPSCNAYNTRSLPQNDFESPPWVKIELLRNMLRQAHTKFRQADHAVKHTLLLRHSHHHDDSAHAASAQ